MPFLDPTLPYPGPPPDIPVFTPPPSAPSAPVAPAPLPIPPLTPAAPPSGPLPPPGGWTPEDLTLPAAPGTASPPPGGSGGPVDHDPTVPPPGSSTPPPPSTRPPSTTPGVPRGGFTPAPRPAPVGSGGSVPAATAAQSPTPGLQLLGAPLSTVPTQDPRSVLESLFRSRDVDPDSPTGPLASLGNVDYYVGRVQDTGGWQGGNIPYWKNRLAQDLDLGQTGVGARPAQNQALIDAGLGNQPGAYAGASPPADERMARTRGRLLDLLRPAQDRQSPRANPATQILEPASELEQRYAQQAQPGPRAPSSVVGSLTGDRLAARRVQLQEAVRQAQARGDAPGARAAQQALATLAGQDPQRQALLSGLQGPMWG